MPFVYGKTTQNKKNISQKIQNKIQKAKTLQVQKNQNKHKERAALCTSLVNASLTIEAALIIPIFMFIIVSMMSFLVLINTEIKEQAKLENQVRSLSRVMELSENMDQTVYLYNSFNFEFPFLPNEINTIKIYLHCKSRAWVGTTINEDDDSNIVYITETGSVYHKTKECSHLSLTIQKCTYGEAKELRNSNGEKYTMCELCGESIELSDDDIVYITINGDKIHTDINCSGLKRTIYAIDISEVGERTACSRCWTD